MNLKYVIFISLIMLAEVLPASASDSVLIVFDADNANAYADSEIPAIYYFNDEIIIAEVSVSKLEILKNRYSDLKIIDLNPWESNYYLISRPDKKPVAISRSNPEIIFSSAAIAILKTEQSDLSELRSQGYFVIRLLKQPISSQEQRYSPALSNIKTALRTEIEDLIASVNPDSIGSVIQALQDFQTRYAFAETHDAVAEWIQSRFFSLGFTEVEIDSFYQDGVWHKNVIAVLPGYLIPEKHVMIGGHHDSIVQYNPDPDPMVYAPGADDNASACAATLEIARVLKDSDYQPKISLMFVTFAAEEVGLWGSSNYAAKLADQGFDLKAMLNNDQIANNDQEPGEWVVNIPMYSGYEYLRDISVELMSAYTTLNFGFSVMNSLGSDSYSFWNKGYPAVFYCESDMTPYGHTNYDLLENCELDYCAEVTRLSAAFIIYLADMPLDIENLSVQDTGSGNSLLVSWDQSPDPDFGYYELGIGISENSYDLIYQISNPEFQINDLEEGIEYYIGVSTYDLEGNQSFIIEVTGIPLSTPRIPENLLDNPGWFNVTLSWDDNQELDLQGYHLYRSEIEGEEPILLNQQPVDDNSFTDSEPESGQYYYYYCRAVDQDGNLSDPTPALRSRAVTLDQQILLVDDTADGNGNFMHPAEEDSDQYYDQLLAGFEYSIFDTSENPQLKLADLGPYSTIIWHVNDISYQSTAELSTAALADYLSFGGQLMVNGFKPSQIFSNEASYPLIYQPGDFFYDHLKISEINLDNFARFFRADADIPGYETILVDTTKTLASLNYHLINIESITPAPSAGSVFTYGSQFEDGHPFGNMNGMPVSSFYSGEDFKVVILSFPLFYMELSASRDLVQDLLLNYFNETSGIVDDQIVIHSTVRLSQNHPNPFNPSTRISFELNKSGSVSLDVYNLKGQKIINLARGNYAPGNYDLLWDGSDKTGKPVASGIYLYRLDFGDQQLQRKMILFK